MPDITTIPINMRLIEQLTNAMNSIRVETKVIGVVTITVKDEDEFEHACLLCAEAGVHVNFAVQPALLEL